MWFQGQKAALNLMKSKSVGFSGPVPGPGPVPDQSALTYTSGFVALGCGYLVTQKALVALFLPTEKAAMPTTRSSQEVGKIAIIGSSKRSQSLNYVPPQSVKEFFQRAGKPALIRIGAAGFAFFCSGAVQTHLALKWNKA
jgi:hypothetical protein